jgi:hypothetical protein
MGGATNCPVPTPPSTPQGSSAAVNLCPCPVSAQIRSVHLYLEAGAGPTVGTTSYLRFGLDTAADLQRRPATGVLFPRLVGANPPDSFGTFRNSSPVNGLHRNDFSPVPQNSALLAAFTVTICHYFLRIVHAMVICREDTVHSRWVGIPTPLQKKTRPPHNRDLWIIQNHRRSLVGDLSMSTIFTHQYPKPTPSIT